MNEAVRVGVLCALALWFALIEIEIEGPHGWAVRLPTWFRTRGPAGRVYGALSGGKPLTGYHLFMASLPLVILHLPFGYGVDWSWAAEVMVLATYLAFAIGWDYLWFILNPFFGLGRFRRGEVWWYSGPWIGRLPWEYYLAVAASFAVAAIAWPLGRGAAALAQQGRLVLGLALLCLLAMAAAPAYRRWYRWMRRPGADEHDAVAAAAADREP
ncbi:MAG TPA: hypothetical protein VHK00_04140 [Miltoncostaeaceae bacterium]|nr:hypothetical protein [Miltoncostaeaceae bacterium]